MTTQEHINRTMYFMESIRYIGGLFREGHFCPLLIRFSTCETIKVQLPKIRYASLPLNYHSGLRTVVETLFKTLAKIQDPFKAKYFNTDWHKELDDTIAVLATYIEEMDTCDLRIQQRTTFLCSLVHAGLLKSQKYPEKYVKPANTLRNTVLSVPELQREICLYL